MSPKAKEDRHPIVLGGLDRHIGLELLSANTLRWEIPMRIGIVSKR